MSGWIKLHRKLLSWEWYSRPVVKSVFIHSLLRANHKDGKWQGKDIKRGSYISSVDKLVSELGHSRQEIRTALKHLKSTNELTSSSGSQHTVFTVVNYENYQDATMDQPEDNQRSTNDQPTINQPSTTNKNVNKEKNEKNEISLVKPTPKDDLSYEPFFILGMDQVQIDEVKQIRKDNKGGKITQRIINALAKEFSEAKALGLTNEGILNEWASRGWKSFKAEWTQQAKSGNTGWNANKNALVEGGAYSQKTAQTIDILNNWIPEED
tara:strand:- start:19112 stop:19912 length:801 start_codon:yes stop_codon:yes gene_type:complete